MEKKDYKEYSDELLVRMARDGDEKAENFLLKKYKDFVRGTYRIEGKGVFPCRR